MATCIGVQHAGSCSSACAAARCCGLETTKTIENSLFVVEALVNSKKNDGVQQGTVFVKCGRVLKEETTEVG
jgi:hypothetical protein